MRPIAPTLKSKSVGTCKQGERSDLTGCTPAKPDPSQPNQGRGTHDPTYEARRQRKKQTRSYQVGRRMAEECRNCTHVLGRLEHTSKAGPQQGKAVLVSDEWTPTMNDGWLDVAIEQRRPVEFAHPVEQHHFRKREINPDTGEETEELAVLHHEVSRLLDAGYAPVRDEQGRLVSMRPPGAAEHPQKSLFGIKKLVEKKDKRGRRYCYDDERGAYHRMPCPDHGAASASNETEAASTPNEIEAASASNETEPLPPLHPAAAAVLSRIDEGLDEQENKALSRITAGYNKSPEQIKEAVSAWYDQAEFTINFNPAMKVIPEFDENGDPVDVDGWDSAPTVAESIAHEKRLKNLFEVGTGNGDTNQKHRRDWEATNFGIDVDEGDDLDPKHRPKYGAVNFTRAPGGGALGYGQAVIVLNKDHLKDRITITPYNSSDTESYQVATAERPLNALLRTRRIDEMLTTPPGSRSTPLPGSYVEFQVWGELPLNKSTVAEVRLPNTGMSDKSYRQIKELCGELGIPVKEYRE